MDRQQLIIVYNYRSPFCALIVDRIFDLARRYDITLVWRIARDVPRPSSLPITRDNPRFSYNREDCERRARWLGLPWAPPDWRLEGTEAAARLGQWLMQTGAAQFEAFTIAANRAYWCYGRDASDPKVIRQIALETGVGEDQLRAAEAAAPELDLTLDNVAEWCAEAGVLGAPFFIFGDQRLWGSDRIDAVERLLDEAGLRKAGEPLFPAEPAKVVPVQDSGAGVAANRIFCIGRNYAEHAAEMGFDAERDPPFYFMKYTSGLVIDGTPIAYPPLTENLHYEMELVAVIGSPACDIPEDRALEVVFGYAAGLDMTRRDLQLAARDKGRPWEPGKAFDQSAVIGPIRRACDIGAVPAGRLALEVNGKTRQSAEVSDMIWSVAEIVSFLSRSFVLHPGDLIFTGTPAGVGPVVAGDILTGQIEGVGSVSTRILPASPELNSKPRKEPTGEKT